MLARVSIGFLIAFSLSAVAFAQAYPERPVRLIVSYPLGGLDASSEQGPAERGAGTRLRDATVKLAESASFLTPAPCASPGSDPRGSPLPPCDAPRLRDATVRESAAAAVLIAQASIPTEKYPDRPIRLIVSYPPGGGTDVTARTIVVKLSEGLGKQVVIDNRPGAGSTIGTDLVAKATPDGYTLLMSDTTFGIIPGLYAKLPFNALKDFQPVTQITSVPVGLVVYPALPVNSVKELVALAKAKPGTLNFGSGGIGTPVHMAGELLKLAAHINIVHIPYKGAGPAFTDLLGGHFQLMFPTLQSAVPHIKSGRLRLIALTSEKRSSAFPDTPVMEEAGVPGVIAVAWFGIHAPKATPQAVIARLHAEAVKVLQDPVVMQRFSNEGADIVGSSPAQFAQFISAEIAKWTKVVKDGGIKAE